MADNEPDNANNPPRILVPPVVSALKQEARGTTSPTRSIPMERTPSEDIREEREDLREAAEQTLNVIVDVDLDGLVKWVSPSWKEVIGTPVDEVEGKPISDIVLDNKDAFMDAVESMKKDDSRSQIVRFAVKIGPTSVFWQETNSEAEEGEEQTTPQTGEFESQQEPEQERDLNVLDMEGQGIMVFDRSPNGELEKGHTMWMLRPSPEPREVTIDLPPMLVESLGVGAEVLANYLTVLAEVGINDPAHHPPPMPVLCRICERQITPWWFEKHSELCLQEHRAEMDVQMAQENLNEHRHAIVKVLDGLEARKGRSLSGELSPQPEYKNLPIGPPPSSISGSSSSSGTPPLSRDPSTSGLGHSRGRSFAVRRPLARIVELILDLCDTALEISTPALKESRTEFGEEFRTQSPQSESRISQVRQWQSPSSNTLDQEQGLAALAADTEAVARAKVDAVTRHRTIVEYGERIRVEFTLLVEECIAAAMSKAERIAAGELSDSSSTSESPETESQEDSPEPPTIPHAPESASAPPGSLASSAVIAPPPRPPSDNAGGSQQDTRSSSVAVSTRSSSPMECPTPRSHRSVPGLLSQAAKRGSLLAESDAGAESDSSAPSSALTGGWRTESPSSERGLTRATSTRDRKRQSLILPGMSSSPRRESPARNPPHSPLRLSKPRLSLGESLPSPTTSPLLNTTDLSGSSVSQYYPSLSHHHHHHRRQSSTTSPDSGRAPISPHMTSASHPPPRAVAPSIKDFEIVKPISKGAFGSVYLSKKKSTGEYFAIKVLKKADMVAKNQVTNVKAERAIMMWQGESDFVAKLYWTFSSKDYLYLVMEYLNGGDCASLVKVLGGLPEDWAKKYIAEVVLGVEHLHGRGIVHRDLKPDNLLIDQKGHLKLTDFGLSRMGLVGRQKRILKNPNESAPDLLKQGPFTRATSLASSRSASFDFPATQSPNSTPLITPEVGSLGQPSYFSLRESSLSREHSRRASGYRSDSGGSDTLSAMFRNFSLHDIGDTPLPVAFSSHISGQQQQGPSNDEELQSEGSDSPHLFPLQPSTSHQTSGSGQHSTPPQQSLMPPPMALFDPEDHNRIFVGTPDYLAPETINGVGQDEMSDWWSLGCILFEFLYGYPPFNASTPDEVFQNILNRRINWPDEADELVTPEAKDIMNRLMTIHPEKRLGANIAEKYPNGGAEIRSHPWFSDVNWDTLLEDKAQFVPAPENLEDTEYFDPRGATLQSFTEELEDQLSPPTPGVTGEYQDRPHDALFKVRSQVNTAGKRGMMPLHIPPHVRDSRSRRLSEPVLADDFGNFSFKNLPVLEKANKDVIQKLRQEAMQAQQRPVPPNPPAPTSSGPSLEGSPLIPMPLKRTMSQNKPGNRPASPSNVSQANSNSPGRPSQPSSPLLVQFSTGQGLERRKTSGSSTFSHHSGSHHSSGSLQPGGPPDPPRLSTNFKVSPSSASSPIKQTKAPTPSPEKFGSVQRQNSSSTSRSRSQTVGSQDSEMGVAREPFVPGHHKRRSQLLDVSPSSSDNEDPRAKAFLKVQRRRQSSRRLSQINLPEGPHFRPLDVLICEDHPVSKLVMERLFEKLRCRTITAVNGSEAIRYALSEVQFDIIMMEFKLPQINGADVARMLRETRSPNTHTPIVAVTGYLKDLPEAHHFDALIEKPPTITKLTEALCKFCHWKPPAKETPTGQSLPMQSLLPRHISNRLEDSPSSTTTSSSFVPMPASSYQGSSREDSLGSSYFGDLEAIKPEELPVVVSGTGVGDWANVQAGGLGISDEGSARAVPAEPASAPPPAPHLPHSITAPSRIPVAASRTPRRHRSVDGIRAKRESLEKRRYEGAESGDDEDEELGHVQVRAKSPHTPSVPHGHSVRSGSKLGIEMMRTNSRGSVVSADELPIEAGKDPEVLGTITSSPERIDEGVERLRSMDDVLETLPEDTEKEDSCTPHPPPSGSLEAKVSNVPNIPPADEMDKTLPTPTTNQAISQSNPPKSPTAPQPGSETEVAAQKGSLTPPGTIPKQETTTPEPQHTSLATTEDTEATPRPAQSASETDTEPTPRASDRDRSRTRDKVIGWIKHK